MSGAAELPSQSVALPQLGILTAGAERHADHARRGGAVRLAGLARRPAGPAHAQRARQRGALPRQPPGAACALQVHRSCASVEVCVPCPIDGLFYNHSLTRTLT